MNDGGIGLELELGIGSDTSLPVVDEAQLTDAIRSILQDADLEQLSRRMIRKQLEAQFHMDLSHYKDTINATILDVIEQQTQQQEDEDEDGGAQEPSEEEDGDDDDDADDERERRAPRKKAKAATGAAKKKAAAPAKRKRAAPSSSSNGDDKKTSNAFNMELSLSPELASVVGRDRMARPQIVKALWEYIREHELQDPSNKRTIVLDAKLRSVFQRDSVTMFSMNKFVKRHVRKPEDLPPGGWAEIHRDGVSSDEDADPKPAKKKAAPAKRKKKAAASGGGDDDEDGDGGSAKKARRANNPFNSELAISPELAAVVGSDRMARPQIVKALWEYIHAHNLQDPADKRTILLDRTLRQVFQRDSVTMFSMNKYIKRHARKPEDMPAGGWAAIPRDGLSSDEDESKSAKKKPAKKIKKE